LDPRVDFERFSVGTYVGNDGLIKTAVDHEPRFDHDPVTGESLGLLVEEERTNLVDNSIPIDFSTNEWRALNGTNTANSATSPDGSSTAAKFVSTSGQTDIRQYIPQTAVVSGNTYVVSVFVKANPYSYFRVGKTGVSDISGTQSSSFGATFDLNTGTTDGLGNTDSWIEDYGNGWYRCSVAFIANSNTNAFIIFYPKNSSYDSLTGDGVSGFYFWGGVIEEGSFPTSYIPTSGSTVTRAADVASITGSNFSSWYNQSEGSLFSQYIPTAGYGRIKFWNGKGNNLNYWSTGPTSTASGVFGFSTRSNQGSTTSNGYRGRIEDSTNYGYVIKHAAAIADNDFACYTSSSSGDVDLNTGSPVPAIGEYLTPLVDRLILTDNLTGVIRLSRLTYYPTRLSDTILQNLTL
jgi:hypothetical protein